jgi:diphthamide synthase (EF-2-diphthine--ammonia ligase)
MKKVLLSWSSGKDSAWALHLLSQRKDVQVAGLVTTFNRAAGALDKGIDAFAWLSKPRDWGPVSG